MSETSEGGFEDAAGCQVWRAACGGDAGIDEVGDDETEEGDLLIEAGDEASSGIVIELPWLEFASVEAMLEGVGVSGLPTWAASWGGDRQTPFCT